MPKELEFVKDLDKIIILAQGPSWYQCPDEWDEKIEVWGSNSIYRDHKVDRLFFGHDIRSNMLDDDYDLVPHLNEMGVPVYTSGIFKVLKKSAQIPLLELMQEFRVGFFLNVITYMIGTAVLQRPKTIDLYGVDMRPDAGGESYQNEKGSVEFWCGVAVGRGIQVKTTAESFVLKTKQEGFFPNARAKVPQKGIYSLIPEQDRNKETLKQYTVLPVGDEI